MMDTQSLIGMPLWYVKSVLEKNGISYVMEETKSCNSFFKCNQQDIYVIRIKDKGDSVQLLINRSLEMSEEVRCALHDKKGSL